MKTDTIVRLEDICKTYAGGVTANYLANLSVSEGEIHAIVGENGAGKSTLMNILYGIHQPDSGKIFIDGREVVISNPKEAKKNGIGMVHQHFMLVPSFTVLQNIMLGYEPIHHLVFVDQEEGARQVQAICDRYNLKIPLNSLVKDISVGIQQRVEIIKAIYRGADILILDEPTAVLTPFETEELFKICHDMVEKDKTILFISHKLKEVLTLSDHITVMRKGQTLTTVETSHTNEQELARLIIGREKIWSIEKKGMIENPETILDANCLTAYKTQGATAIKNISFQVKSGEIVGIAGVEGNGQTELMEVLAGLRPLDQGELSFTGRLIGHEPVSTRRATGIRYVPEDRMTTGASIKASIKENLVIDQKDRDPFITHGGFLHWKKIETYAQQMIKKFNIVAGGPNELVGSLSGGNLQKVVVAREISASPKCLLVLQPTRGLDIGASEYIYRELLSARMNGSAIILVSADLDELFLLSDRILVLYEGENVAEFLPGQITPEELGLYMTGVKKSVRADARE